MDQKEPGTLQNTLTDWFEQYGDDLFKRALYKISDKDTAEDLVQETFIAAMKSFGSFRGDSNPKTWLYSILNNKIVDHYRKQARSFLKFETDREETLFRETEGLFDSNDRWIDTSSPSTWDEKEDLLSDPDFRTTMESCMEDLPVNWKTILLSKYLMGKEGREICKELSITPSNYWQILHRSKLMLKKCIDKHWFEKK